MLQYYHLPGKDRASNSFVVYCGAFDYFLQGSDIIAHRWLLFLKTRFTGVSNFLFLSEPICYQSAVMYLYRSTLICPQSLFKRMHPLCNIRVPKKSAVNVKERFYFVSLSAQVLVFTQCVCMCHYKWQTFQATNLLLCMFVSDVAVYNMFCTVMLSSCTCGPFL